MKNQLIDKKRSIKNNKKQRWLKMKMIKNMDEMLEGASLRELQKVTEEAEERIKRFSRKRGEG